MADSDDIVLFARPPKKARRQNAAGTGAVGGAPTAIPEPSKPSKAQQQHTHKQHHGDSGLALAQQAQGEDQQRRGGAKQEHNAEEEQEDRQGVTESADAGPGPGSDADAAAAPAPRRQPRRLADEAREDATFKSLGLSEWLCTVCHSLGMRKPTQVQQGCVPSVLAGKDVIGLAQTGSGKTAAFALPILQLLAQDPFGVFALVLTPTRELAVQISEQFRAMAAGMTFRDAVVIGGVDMQAQSKELSRRPHVVVATPGRLKGLLDADVSLAAGFKRCRFLVLDEADRLLDANFEAELRAILRVVPPGEQRQTLLFSATMTQALIRLQEAALDDAFVFQAYEGLQTASTLREQYLLVPVKVKEVYLAHLLGQLEELKVRSVMVFSSTCKGCAQLAAILRELGLPCAELHSGQPQKLRMQALANFKSSVVRLLLATDVASRGLDIPTVDLVVNYDLPSLASDYVHRVGRTGRAGRGGWALSLVTQHDVQLVHAIESLVGHQLQPYEVDEAAALKGLSKVYAAKRSALLALTETDELTDGRAKQRAKQRAQRTTQGGAGKGTKGARS